MPYDLRPISAPRVAGRWLRTFVALLENPLTRAPIIEKLFTDIGVVAMRRVLATDPLATTFLPDGRARSVTPGRMLALDEAMAAIPESHPRGARPVRAADYVRAYRDRGTRRCCSDRARCSKRPSSGERRECGCQPWETEATDRASPASRSERGCDVRRPIRTAATAGWREPRPS